LTLFVIIMTHSADECPTANSRVRKLLSNESQEVTKLGAKVGVTFLIGPLMGATNHQSYAVVEAPNIETVTDLMFRSGLIQWNKVDVVHALTVDEAVKHMKDLQPIL